MQNIFLRKGLVVGILVLFVGAGVIPSMVGIIVKRHVSQVNKTSFMEFKSNGNIWYVGGTGGGNYSSIQDAIDNASNGDTVFVFDDSSPYYENIFVDKSINLIGEDRNTTIIDGSGIKDVVSISNWGVNISGFKIRNSGNISNAGINIRSSNNIISGNIISPNNFYGINIYSSSSNIISGNTISLNNLYAIFLSFSSNNIISGNTISSNNDSGIYLSSSSNNTISGNNISSNSEYGLVFGSSSNNTISGNNISSNSKPGIIFYPFSNNNIISGNIISLNENHGIQLSSSNNYNIISGNNISSNNNSGIYLGSSSNNVIYNNYFNNTNNAYDDGNNSWNITKILGTNIIGGPCIGGNYWNDYMGIDINGDGLGDTNLPYNNYGNIVQGGDWLPLLFWQDEDPPEIIDNTLGIGYTGDLFTFNATITDIGGVFFAWVEYWYGTGTHTNTSMSNISDDNWERTIIVNDTIEIMHYIIATQDIALNWNNTIIKNVTINDNDYPQITNVEAVPSIIIGEGYVNLSATVIDNIEVDNVYLHIIYPNFIVENFSITQNRTDDTYYSNRSYNMPGNYTFYIWANDTGGNANSSANYSFKLQNNPPIVNFTYSPANPTKRDIIQFNDTSIDLDGYVTAWFWDFGDHYFSDAQNPIHCYYIPNSYNVSLTVTDNSGVKNSYETVINISDALGFITDLQQGWNNMGLPTDTSLMKEDIIIRNNSIDYTWQEAVDGGIILDFIYGWDRINKLYMLTNTFDPGYGYWMYAYYECILLRPIT